MSDEGQMLIGQRSRLLERIARGEKAIEDGRMLTHAQAEKQLMRWLANPEPAPRQRPLA